MEWKKRSNFQAVIRSETLATQAIISILGMSVLYRFLTDVYSSNPEGGRGRSSPTSSGYSKPRRPNRATQSYYVPPRQQKYKDKG